MARRAAGTAALLAALATARAQSPPLPPAFHRGVVFGAGEWSHPAFDYASPGAAASLAALAATGASHVRLLVTGFVDNASTATAVYALAPPSALATETVAQLAAAMAAARALNLSVVLCPVLDPNWDALPAGARSIDSPHATSRLQIASGYTAQAQWDAFFASFRTFAFPYYRAAAAAGAAMIEVTSELDYAFARQPAAWRALVADIRAIPFAGAISVAANAETAASMGWADALDFIGVDVYSGLGAPLPLGVAPSVGDLVAAYDANVAPLLAPLAAMGAKIIISETGFQSRPNCHVRPWGTPLLDPDDDSAWVQVVDTACQANGYEALLRWASAQPYIFGVYFWLWRSDPTTGGTFNGDFTPHGKPAEAVLRRWFGGDATAAACAASGAYNASSTPPLRLTSAADAACDGSAALLAARRGLHAALGGEPSAAARAAADAAIGAVGFARTPALARVGAHARTRRTFNGWVVGTPDEWSSPYYRLPSAGSLASLDDMVASTGADSVEVIAQWWFDNITDTEIYPITDPASPLYTSTDEELGAYVAAAKARGLKTVFTLMLDPNWLLPAQAGCRDTNKPGCYWRGQVGTFFPDDCSPNSTWARWHKNYAAATMHFARLSAAWGIDAFLLSHELYNPSTHCPDLWAALLAAVRGVFSGAVSSVLATAPGYAPAQVAAQFPWAKKLDFAGVDCYFKPSLPPHPAAPWQDLPLSDLLAGQAALMPALANLSGALGLPIVCTEIGMPSRPWAYTTWGGTLLLDPEDCSVWDQCVSIDALRLVYESFLSTYYAQPWCDGMLFWHWRADPTSGGMSSDGFTVQGKPPVTAVIKAYWGA